MRCSHGSCLLTSRATPPRQDLLHRCPRPELRHRLQPYTAARARRCQTMLSYLYLSRLHRLHQPLPERKDRGGFMDVGSRSSGIIGFDDDEDLARCHPPQGFPLAERAGG